MSAKISIEDIKKIYESNGLNLLEDTTKGICKNYKCCDNEGYFYYYGAKNLKKQGISDKKQHRFSSKNPFAWDNVLHYMKENVHNGTTLVSTASDWKNRDSLLSFKCGVCGAIFKKSWSAFMSLDFKMCTRCFNQAKDDGIVPTKRTDPFLFREKLLEKGLYLLAGDNLTHHSKVLIQDKMGYRGLVSLGSLYSREEVGFDKFSVANPFTIDNLRLYTFLKEWDCIIPDQNYKGNKGMLKIRCSCGRSFEVTATHFLNGKYKCNKCRGVQSELSEIVEKWLKDHDIQYQMEKRFDDCKNKGLLPFDYYIPEVGCIEVDGQLHFYSRGDNKNDLLQVQTNDRIKTEYCRKNNIPLLRLPYWEIEDGETYQKRLKQFLSIED